VDIPDVSARYDEGYFDKDEQGWCSRNVDVVQTGARVLVHRWGDDNGARPHDERLEGEIAAHFEDLGLVTFSGGLAAVRFNLKTRRLERREALWSPLRGPDGGLHQPPP
jgi:hypothetical protein